MRNPVRSLLAATVVLLVVAAGCAHDQKVTAGGSSTTVPDPGEPTTTTTAPPTTEVVQPGGYHDLVFRVVDCCGFTSADVALTSLPIISVMGDGTALLAGEGLPGGGDPGDGAALPNIRRGNVPPDALAALIEQARADGFLDHEVDFGTPGVTDLAYTTVTMVVDGTTHTLSAYALGYHSDPAEPRPQDGGTGVSAAQEELRTKLSALISSARDAVHDPARAYVPERISVFALPVPDASNGVVTPTVRPWPLDDPGAWAAGPAGVERCRTYAGADAQTVFAAAQAASVADIWGVTGKATHRLEFRPLLPDETSKCEQT